MGAQEDKLNAEIERAKADLTRDLAELRAAAGELQQKIARAAAAAVAAYAVYRVARFVWRRSRR